MRKLFFIIFLLGYLALTTITFAEEKKNEWVDQTYNFKQLKTVMVQYSIDKDVTLDDLEKQKLINKIDDIFFKNNQKLKPKLVSLQQIEDTIGKINKVNMTELKINDYIQYNDLLEKNLPNLSDATVKLTISSQGYTTRHIPVSVEYVTEHHYTYITHWNSNPYGPSYSTTETIDVPTITPRIIPAYDIKVGHAGVIFELYPNITPQAVWRLTDIREADGKQPIDMTGRICSRSIGRLADLVKGKK